MVKNRRSAKWVVLLVTLLVLLCAWLNRVAIQDWFRLLGYTPPLAISSLANANTMTSEAKHLYYINRPQIIAKEFFGTRCTTSEKTIVLGCYHPEQNGIYILRISDDSRLDGVMEVTAAHEMLHAAYDRLDQDERKQIDAWLQAFYNNQLEDKRVKDTVDSYRESEPNDVVNEMHSIFATEVMDLPSNLEHYYQRYFANRKQVAQYTANYRAEFTKREKQVAAYDKQLNTLKATIDANEKTLDAQADAIYRLQTELDTLKSNKQYAKYNALVDTYNQRVRDYNVLLNKTKADIKRYNQIVEKRNAVALESKQLSSELQGELPSL